MESTSPLFLLPSLPFGRASVRAFCLFARWLLCVLLSVELVNAPGARCSLIGVWLPGLLPGCGFCPPDKAFRRAGVLKFDVTSFSVFLMWIVFSVSILRIHGVALGSKGVLCFSILFHPSPCLSSVHVQSAAMLRTAIPSLSSSRLLYLFQGFVFPHKSCVTFYLFDVIRVVNGFLNFVVMEIDIISYFHCLFGWFLIFFNEFIAKGSKWYVVKIESPSFQFESCGRAMGEMPVCLCLETTLVLVFLWDLLEMLARGRLESLCFGLSSSFLHTCICSLSRPVGTQ